MPGMQTFTFSSPLLPPLVFIKPHNECILFPKKNLFDMIYFNDFYCAASAVFPAGRSLYKSTWDPPFFFISFFF